MVSQWALLLSLFSFLQGNGKHYSATFSFMTESLTEWIILVENAVWSFGNGNWKNKEKIFGNTKGSG